MNKFKKILFFIFPVPAKSVLSDDKKLRRNQARVDWTILTLTLSYMYIIFVLDVITFFEQKISFEDSFGFFVFNNHIAAFGSLTTLALSIVMLHFIARVQEEAPEDLGGRVLFNFFLVFLFGVTLYFKHKHIDPVIGQGFVTKYEESLVSNFKGQRKKKYLSILKERLAKGKFKKKNYHYEVLCELGLVDGCTSVAEVYSKDKSSKHYWSLKRALGLDPENATVLNNLAWSMATDKKYKTSPEEMQRAMDYAQKAVELEPKNHYYNDTLAYVLFKNKQCEKAQTFQFLAIKYLKLDIERKPSSELKNEYKQRLEMYKECKVDN